MKRLLLRTCLLASAAFLAACDGSQSSPSAAGSAAGGKWLGDFEEAVKAAKAANKPILMDFGADW